MKNNRSNLIIDNPVLVQSFGLLPVIAVTKSLKEALVMSVVVITVMILSSTVISLLKKLIDEDMEYISFLAIIASFTTIVVLLAQKLVPDVSMQMGIYLPLIAVNSLILYRIRAYAVVQSVGDALVDSIITGAGFLLIMTIVSAIRELIGVGTLFGFRIIPTDYTIPTFTEPVFGFIIVGLLIAFFKKISRDSKLKEAR